MTVLEAFTKIKKEVKSKSCAAIVKDNTLHYLQSMRDQLPAAITVLDETKKQNLTVYTDLPEGHWLYKLTSAESSDTGTLRNVSSDGSEEVNEIIPF